METIHFIILAAYIAAGVYCFFWIKLDAEFRTGPWLIMGILSLFLWPIMFLIWLLVRGEEHMTSIAAKQSHRDFQIYMRTKKDKDLFTSLPKASSTKTGDEKDVAYAQSNDIEAVKKDNTPYHDYNLEKLIENGHFDEALAAARSMKKVAINMQEEERVARYDEYIHRIEQAKRAELD